MTSTTLLDSLSFSLLPFASWAAIAALQHHGRNAWTLLLHAVEACRPLPGDSALSLDKLVVTVRMNMRFSKLVAALFDYGMLVRPLAQQAPAMPITLHEFALWEQARSLVLDTVGVWGTGLLPSEVAVEKIFSLLEGPLVVCAQQAAGNALCLGAGYLSSV